MSIAEKILKWNDERYDSITMDTKHPCVKAFTCGVVEGLVDASVIVGAVVITAAVCGKKITINKK